MNVTALFCSVDDFCKVFIPMYHNLLENKPQQTPRRPRQFTMSPSEVMTLLILFHQSGFRHFKGFYTQYVPKVLGKAFPRCVSYQRFIELSHMLVTPLTAYLHSRRVKSKGIAFIDSTSLRVCQNRRANRSRNYAKDAGWGKSSTGWYYGFKLHLVTDDRGELISFFITQGNYDDRRALVHMCKFITGKLYGDKGYVSKELREDLFEQDIELFTYVRRNMKPIPMEDFDKILLRKRSIIETINDQLKNVSQIEHSRHRSTIGIMINVISALIAYSWQPKKPSLNIRSESALVVVDECLYPSTL